MSVDNYHIKDLTLISDIFGEYSIAAGATINYFEDILSPTISVSIEFVDTDGLISNGPVVGGEYLNAKIEVPNTGTFEITSENRIVVNSVNDSVTNSSKQLATLKFCSIESLINESSRINRKYNETTIDNAVEKILKSDPRGLNTSKNLDKEATKNKYIFLGNQKRPMELIQWLCPKSMSGSGGSGGGKNVSGGFLFFETNDGYVFKSVDTLLEQNPVATYVKSETVSSDEFRILNESTNKNSDLTSMLRMGMYSNVTVFFDPVEMSYGVERFSISQAFPNSPKLPIGLESAPTRLMFKVLDRGLFEDDPKNAQPKEELGAVQANTYARMNLLFSQSLNITIPCNPSLRAGQTIECKFPAPTSDQKAKSYGDGTDISGKYLISQLRHVFSNNRCYTGLKLVRDSFAIERRD